MTYDDEVWDAVDDAIKDQFDGLWYHDRIANTATEAIPPLTLKTADGQFYRVESVTLEEFDPLDARIVYRIIEDQP